MSSTIKSFKLGVWYLEAKFSMHTSIDRVERIKSKFVVTTMSTMYNTGSTTIG